MHLGKLIFFSTYAPSIQADISMNIVHGDWTKSSEDKMETASLNTERGCGTFFHIHHCIIKMERKSSTLNGESRGYMIIEKSTVSFKDLDRR